MKKPPSGEDEGLAKAKLRTIAGPNSTSSKNPGKPQIVEQLLLPLNFTNEEANR